jgi:hypothetical protein
MKRRMLVCVAILLGCSPAIAQEPAAFERPANNQQAELLAPQIAPDAVTPEMYLYLQELRRHDDPVQAVRRKAEIRAQQRMGRIAAMKWFGMSNARPQANLVPFMGVYSPSWIGNGYDRYDWAAISWPAASVTIQANTVGQ